VAISSCRPLPASRRGVLQAHLAGGVGTDVHEARLEGVEGRAFACAAARGLFAGVNSKVATLAGGDNVGAERAGWVAFAEVRGGEDHESAKVDGGASVEFEAAAHGGVGLVEAALAGAFAAASRALVLDVVGERLPVLRVARAIEGHGALG